MHRPPLLWGVFATAALALLAPAAAMPQELSRGSSERRSGPASW